MQTGCAAGRHFKLEEGSDLLDSKKFKAYLDQVSSLYDHVFIDSSPTAKSADSIILGDLLKDVIFIMQPEQTRRSHLLRAIHEFKQLDINVLGSVIYGDNISVKLQPPLTDENGYSESFGEEGSKIFYAKAN